MRCSKCGEVFRVELPPAETLPMVWVAEPDPATAKAIAGYLESWGLGSTVIESGGDVLLRFFRAAPESRPAALVLGGHLPGVAGPAVAEIIKRTGDLATTRLIRIAPMDEPPGVPEFEADHMLEPADLPQGLAPILERLGLGQRPSAGPPATPPTRRPQAQEPQATESQAAEPPAAEAPRTTRRRTRPPTSSDPAIAAAERLARIIVSDIILYNEQKFSEGAAAGDVAARLGAELQEAGAMFDKRIPAEVRAKQTFLVDELERRAAAKS